MAANAIILTPSSRIACWTPNFQSAQKTPNPSFKSEKPDIFYHRWKKSTTNNLIVDDGNGRLQKTGHCWKCQERRLTRSTKRPGVTVNRFYLLPSRVGVGVWLGWSNLASYNQVMLTKKIIKWWFSMLFMTATKPSRISLLKTPNRFHGIWGWTFPTFISFELFGKTER